MNNPFSGIRYLLKGFGLIKQPGLRKYVIVPLLINILIFAGLGFLAFGWIEGLVGQMMLNLPDWLQWLSWLIWIVVYAASIILLYFTFTVMANFVSAPFNGVLSEAVEEHITGEAKSDDTPWHQAITQMGPAIQEEVKKFMYSITRSLPFFILFFIPGINFIASAAWMLFGAWMLAVQYADYPFSNNGIEFKNLRANLREKRLMVLGFGGAVMACTMIPLINLLIIPAAVAGATVMYLEQFKAENKSV
ncbi:MAG: sulfate transporter CysZ [Gammaproteobacteria bacterium]|nr:sulfate transporter CysZ [Gammaproteobacteria bacterium]